MPNNREVRFFCVLLLLLLVLDLFYEQTANKQSAFRYPWG